MTELFQYLDTFYEVRVNETCSTHVHISIVNAPFSLEDLKKIARSVLYWEPAWEAITPVERRSNRWAANNWFDNDPFCKKGIREVLTILHNTSVFSDVVKLMNGGLQDPIEIWDEANRRHFRWNFQNLVPHFRHGTPGSGTIEFRGGSGSTDCAMAMRWADIAIAFISASLRLTTTPNGLMPPFFTGSAVGHLQNFLNTGNASHNSWTTLFAGIDPAAYVAIRNKMRREASAAELARRKEKALAEDMKALTFAKIYGSS